MLITDYQTAANAAKRVGKSIAYVRALCMAGKIPGALLFDDAFWIVPRDWVPEEKRPGRHRKNPVAADFLPENTLA